MKYDIHKFEHLHFLIEQIEKADHIWMVGTTSEIFDDENAGKYAAFVSDKAEEVAYTAQNDCPVQALAEAYKQFKDAQEKTDEPRSDSSTHREEPSD